MSVHIHEVKGYEDYQKKINNLGSTNEPVYYWFMGARSNNEQSWCGDCRDTEPVIKEFLNSIDPKQDVHVVCVEIEREDFREPNCGFRTDQNISLTKVPTLLCPSLDKRLIERECMDKDKLDSFFSELKKK